MKKGLLLTFVIVVFVPCQCHASCTVDHVCWTEDSCTINVTPDLWIPNSYEQVTLTHPNSYINNNYIWNGGITDQTGMVVTVQLASYTTTTWGFNVKGSNSIPTFTCNHGTTTTTTTTSVETTTPSSKNYLLPTEPVGDSFDRLVQFVATLTSLVPSATDTRAVHSSGGVASGVVSEGQGYGILIAAMTAASMDDTDTNKETAIGYAYQMFMGWKKMCQLSRSGSNCQGGGYICEGYPCLPHWKFNDELTSPLSTGAAPDGDEDAILGMIILLQATASNKASYTWWESVKEWAYYSCKAFMDFNTVLDSQSTHRILKLGTCWGGWNCVNPSLFAPGAYRTFRNFMVYYSAEVTGSSNEGQIYQAQWNNLIDTIYLVLEGNQCEATGLTTNWFVPSEGNPSSGGSLTCSGSGTPAPEFGSEASRGVWRVALDYFWYDDEVPQGYGSLVYSNRVGEHVTSKLQNANEQCASTSCNSALNLDTGCFVTSVFPRWLDEAFIYGPVFSALMVPSKSLAEAEQLYALDVAANKLNRATIDTYYSGSWIAISTITLNGDAPRLKGNIRQLGPG